MKEITTTGLIMLRNDLGIEHKVARKHHFVAPSGKENIRHKTSLIYQPCP